ncbi:MAG TPA: snapalysin family zinc-dependent metalloprotease [Streptomyces sp.]|nr:snapalysin family zinc-dependent metalloprotease [Streptomyces sp.]
MRTVRTGRLKRRAAAIAPLALTLFAVTACGTEGPDAASPVSEGSISATNDSARVSDARGSDENPSRDSGTRGSGAIGETARPGGQSSEGASAAGWPVDDVVGAVRQAAPRRGADGAGGKADQVLLTYDVGAAAEFTGATRAAAESWNDRVSNVSIRPARAGAGAGIRIVLVKGWPSTDPQGPSLGRGTIRIGRKALDEGHDPVRILAHEFGHMLGLPDKQPGACSSVMAGKSAGVSCTNAFPDQAEQRVVERNFSATR